MCKVFPLLITWYMSKACSSRKGTFRTFHENQSDSYSLSIWFCFIHFAGDSELQLRKSQTHSENIRQCLYSFMPFFSKKILGREERHGRVAAIKSAFKHNPLLDICLGTQTFILHTVCVGPSA